MKTRLPRCKHSTLLVLALAAVAPASTVVLGQSTNAPTAKATNATAVSKTVATPPAAVRFKPQMKGAPSVRLTGGSRGTGESEVTLDVLAPEDLGLTAQEQPSLFWYQSKPSKAKFELTVLQDNKVKPLLRIALDQADKAGIQRVNLAEQGVKLEPGIEYQWVVALITNPDSRSTDLIASGAIKRVAPDTTSPQKLAGSNGLGKFRAAADAGIWYDSLAALSDAIEAQPDDKSLHQLRAEMLRKVGLKAAADYDLK